MTSSAINDRVLIIKGAKTGLGDRIRAVLVGLVYARATGRAISVDWRDGLYGPKEYNAFDALLRIRDFPTLNADDVSHDDVDPPAWRGRLRKSLDEIYIEDGAAPWNREDAVKRYSIDLTQELNCARSVVAWEFTQKDGMAGMFPKGVLAKDVESWAWKHHLDFAPEIVAGVADLLRESPADTLGVHVRASNEFKAEKGAPELREYFATIDRIMKSRPISRIFLATDNIEIVECFHRRYQKVVVQDKWYPDPGAPMHLDPSCPEPLSMARQAAIDLSALSRCGSLITLRNSSFGVVARLASDARKSDLITLDPSRRGWARRIVAFISRSIAG